MALAVCLPGGGAVQGADDGLGVLRAAFSAAIVSELNANDAKATLDVWGSTLAATRNLPLRAESEILRTAEEIGRALREGRVDLVVMRSDEYFAAGVADPGATRLVGLRADEKTEEYQVVVHRTAAPAPKLADLRGKPIVLLDNSRSGLLRAWLDLTLVQQGLEPAARFFGTLSTAAKLSRVVLPVFFGQQAACVVTRSGLRTMIELNPQVGREVLAIATSPPIMPSIVLLRSGFTRERAGVIQALLEMDKTPKGQQVLHLFGLNRLELVAEGDLEAARQLYAAHVRALARTKGQK